MKKRMCKQCGREFEQQSPAQFYCKKACRLAEYYLKLANKMRHKVISISIMLILGTQSAQRFL